jgi:formate dehydrogenase subunit delta
MNIDNLIGMANRIGQFFAAYPNEEASQHDIADHLKKFWEPRMRRALLAHVDANDGAGLEPLVLAAVRAHRTLLTPPPAATTSTS